MKDKYKGRKGHASLLKTVPPSNDSKELVDNSRRLSFDRPTPLDFDAFVPWICMEWQSPEAVHVSRVIQEEYKGALKSATDRKSISSRSKSNKSLKSKYDENETLDKKGTLASAVPSAITDLLAKSSIPDNAIPMKAFYDTRGYLVEVSIVDCSVEIHRKVIQAISICLPFHSLLTRLTIRKGGLTNVLLREIAKMLPHSNLTDVCLDDSGLRGGTYDVICDNTSQLKYLSLNRCYVNDTTCKALAKKIDFEASGSSLLVLELGSNLITDQGLKALGDSLRQNRRLLHLNVSGNKITDAGVSSILCHLIEFEITCDEIVNARKRKLKYSEKKLEVYTTCYEEVMKRQKSDLCTGSAISRKSRMTKNVKNPKEENRKKPKRNTSMFVAEEVSAVDTAEAMALDIVGKFIDPYNEDSVVTKNGCTYSKGNMVLCSLNLANNDLTYMSIKRIYEVLSYQDQVDKTLGATGLMRVVLDENCIPVHCDEYIGIEMFLRKVVTFNASVGPKSRSRTLSATVTKK